MPLPPPLEPAAVRGFVFDLDGTLVDSYAAIAHALNAARAAHGFPPIPAERVRTMVGHGLESLVEDALGPANVASGVRAFREDYDRVCESMTRALPHAAEVLLALRGRGYRASVASNKPARFGTRLLDALGMLRALDAVEGPDTAGSTKPEPTMIRRCCAAMRLAPAAVAYVGDMVLDVESAASAGLPVILVPGGSGSADELRATGHRVLGGIRDLLDLFPPLSAEARA